jgi:nitrous oxidase accessory protein NosD
MLAMRASLLVRCLFLIGIATGIIAALQFASAASGAAATAVRCSTTSLQTAIDSADPGATLAVSGTCLGNFTIDKDLTLHGQGGAVLDGRHGGTTLTVAPGATVLLAGLTITDGTAGQGGGINNSGSLMLNDSTVSNNAGDSGGGIYNTAALTLRDTTVSDNSAVYSGGGIFSCCGYDLVTLKDSTIDDNTAGAGGGVFNLLDYAALIDTTVSGNTATLEGGGIVNNAGGVTLVDTTVRDNTAGSGSSGSYGGGIYTFSGSVSVTESSVSDNSPYNCAPLGAVDGCTG